MVRSAKVGIDAVKIGIPIRDLYCWTPIGVEVELMEVLPDKPVSLQRLRWREEKARHRKRKRERMEKEREARRKSALRLLKKSGKTVRIS